MKQKIVMKLPGDDPKCRTKAMKIVVGLPGVTSATLEPNKIVVVGEGVDAVRLTNRLRKKMGFTELESVSKVEEKKEETKEKAGDTVPLPTGWPYRYGGPPYPYVTYDEPGRDNCTIM